MVDEEFWGYLHDVQVPTRRRGICFKVVVRATQAQWGFKKAKSPQDVFTSGWSSDRISGVQRERVAIKCGTEYCKKCTKIDAHAECCIDVSNVLIACLHNDTKSEKGRMETGCTNTERLRRKFENIDRMK